MFSFIIFNSVQKYPLRLLLNHNIKYLSMLSSCTSINYKNLLSNLKSAAPNRTIFENNFKKQIHSLIRGSENNYVYSVMNTIPKYKNSLVDVVSKKMSLPNVVLNDSDFENILNHNWRLESATNITEAFKKLCSYCQINNITVSDNRFDKLVDGLMDKCQDLSDNELSELLFCLSQYPLCESYTSHNFHDIWSALDDMCMRRIQNWNLKTTLLFTDHWYKLGLAKYSDYCIQAIKKFCRKINKLTPDELVQALFYINVCRKQWSMFEFEVKLQSYLNELTVDELAIVSMAFFKTETVIKDSFILNHMISKLIENASNVHEITLTAILKIVRYSPHIQLVDKIYELLTKLIPEIDRLSMLCCVHIALAGTTTQFFHPDILTKISEKFVKNISQSRLKDLERLIFTLTLFNFIPKTTPHIFELALNELKKEERKHEIEKYPRTFACCVHYLGLQQIYPYDLIDKILDKNFILKTYGGNKQSIGREIFFLNSSLDLDCPDYKGNRLSKKTQNQLTHWTSDWIPRKNQKFRLTAADKLMLDIIDVIEIVHQKDEYIHINYILPHFPKPDIIICKDKHGNPVGDLKYFDKYKMGDIMYPEKNSDFKWFAIVVGSWNMFIRGTSIPVGTLQTKIRHLQQIGYTPVVIPWSEFMPLTRKDKEDYLYKKIT